MCVKSVEAADFHLPKPAAASNGGRGPEKMGKCSKLDGLDSLALYDSRC